MARPLAFAVIFLLAQSLPGTALCHWPNGCPTSQASCTTTSILPVQCSPDQGQSLCFESRRGIFGRKGMSLSLSLPQCPSPVIIDADEDECPPCPQVMILPNAPVAPQPVPLAPEPFSTNHWYQPQSNLLIFRGPSHLAPQRVRWAGRVWVKNSTPSKPNPLRWVNAVR